MAERASARTLLQLGAVARDRDPHRVGAGDLSRAHERLEALRHPDRAGVQHPERPRAAHGRHGEASDVHRRAHQAHLALSLAATAELIGHPLGGHHDRRRATVGLPLQPPGGADRGEARQGSHLYGRVGPEVCHVEHQRCPAQAGIWHPGGGEEQGRRLGHDDIGTPCGTARDKCGGGEGRVVEQAPPHPAVGGGVHAAAHHADGPFGLCATQPVPVGRDDRARGVMGKARVHGDLRTPLGEAMRQRVQPPLRGPHLGWVIVGEDHYAYA